MWISGVDFPQSLIDAHKAGSLVLFVGAGASMGPPSSLPNFVQLVERIPCGRGGRPPWQVDPRITQAVRLYPDDRVEPAAGATPDQCQ